MIRPERQACKGVAHLAALVVEARRLRALGDVGGYEVSHLRGPNGD